MWYLCGVHDFRHLDAWGVAVEIATRAYELTKPFPPDELYGMTSQIRRSAASISANIAEGSGAGTDAEFKRYLMIARASVAELESHVVVCSRVGLVESRELREFTFELARVRAMINGLHRSL